MPPDVDGRSAAGPLPKIGADEIDVVVLNHNGRQHLGPCLRSLVEARGLRGPEAVCVADNGSTDGSLEYVGREFPGVRHLRFEANLGFAAGNNRAAEAMSGPYVLFLNNDTRVIGDALEELARAVGGDVACAGARLVSWDGRHIDFDGGGAAFTGHGHPLRYGRRVGWDLTAAWGSLLAMLTRIARSTALGSRARLSPRPPLARRPRSRAAAPTLFCSGAAMLIHRATFKSIGGFDADYYAYYEDVDLGWRLWLAGFSVHHVPAAVVRHRHHGSASSLPVGAAAVLHERNALATVAKNYAGAILEHALPAALALAACRAGAELDVIRSARSWAVAGASDLPVPELDWPGWRALRPLELDLAGLAARRARVQALRRRPDQEILPLLVAPLVPVKPDSAGWAALRLAAAEFGLEQIFGPLPPGDGLRAGSW